MATHGNKFGVGLSSRGLVILAPAVMKDRNDALNLIAWIAALARLDGQTCVDAIDAVKSDAPIRPLVNSLL